MKPAFETERLRVFKLDLERPDCDGEEMAVTVYHAYDKNQFYQHHPAIECTTWSDSTYVLWIELRHSKPRTGIATELLNGIVEFMKFTSPMGSDLDNEGSKGVFAKHEEWFRSR